MKKILAFIAICVLPLFAFTQNAFTDASHNNHAQGSKAKKAYIKTVNDIREVSGSIICSSFYFPDSAGVILNFTLEVISPDYEYGDSVAMTFPTGMTPTAGSQLNGVDPNTIAGQDISWGVNSDFGDFIPGVYDFTVTLTIDAGVTGDQYVNYFVSGDEYGAPPNEFSDSCLIVEVPDSPYLSLDAEPVSFGRKALGSPCFSGSICAITNIGTDTLRIDTLSGLDGTKFSTNLSDTIELLNGDTAWFGFTYTPDAETDDSASLTIVTETGDTAKTHTYGTGLDVVFVEDFELWICDDWNIINGDLSEGDEQWHQAEDFNNPGNHLAEILYVDGLDPQDEWLYTRDIALPAVSQDTLVRLSFFWMGSYTWSVDPDDNVDINVIISTDGGTTWTDTIWSEGDTALVENSGVDFPWTDWAGYISTIDISDYQGQTINIAWQYVGQDGAQHQIDSVVVSLVPVPDSPELAVTGSLDNEYIITPLTQVQGFTLAAEVENNGGDLNDATDVTVAVVEAPSYSGSGAIPLPLLFEGSADVTITPDFVPDAVNDFTVVFNVDHPSDTVTDNNNDTLTINVSDSVYSRENGISTSELGIGEGSEGVMGQTFEIFTEDTLTSVSLYFTGSQVTGEPYSVDIYSFTATPDAIIASTQENTFTADAAWVTLPVENGGVILQPGVYFLGLNESSAGYSSLGTTEFNFTENTNWVTFGGNPWATAESYGFSVTYLLRANLGDATNMDISEPEITDQISVFPNPSDKMINIVSPEGLTIYVFNILGELVKTINNSENINTIDMSDLDDGTYTIKIISDDNISTGKIILAK